MQTLIWCGQQTAWVRACEDHRAGPHGGAHSQPPDPGLHTCRWDASTHAQARSGAIALPGTPKVVATQWAHDDSWVAVQLARSEAGSPQLLVFGAVECVLWSQLHFEGSVSAWLPRPDSASLLAVSSGGPGDRRIAVCGAWGSQEHQHVRSSRLSALMCCAEHIAVSADAGLVVGLLPELAGCSVLIADANTAQDLSRTVLTSFGPCSCAGLRILGQGLDGCLLLGPRCLVVSCAQQPAWSTLPEATCMAVLSMEAADLGRGLHVLAEAHKCSKALSPCGSFLAICSSHKLQVMLARSGQTISWWPLDMLCSPARVRLVRCDHPARQLTWTRDGRQLCVATSRLEACRLSRLLAVVQYVAAC